MRSDEDIVGRSKVNAVLRDPTRGGVAATLNELAEQSGTGIILDEEAIPVRDEVAGVCDILGFDPLYLANEGKLLAIVPSDKAEEIVEVMHTIKYGENACIIGRVTSEGAGQVGMETAIGGIRLVDMPMGNLVPRIC